MNHYSQDEMKLIKQFENGKMPKKLTGNQRSDLMDRFSSREKGKIFPGKAIEGIDGGSSETEFLAAATKLLEIAKQVNKWVKENDLVEVGVYLDGDRVGVSGSVRIPDAQLIEKFHKCWEQGVEIDDADLARAKLRKITELLDDAHPMATVAVSAVTNILVGR